MKAQDFQALVEQLGDLSQVQREALVEALTATGSGEDVVALIETRFAANGVPVRTVVDNADTIVDFDHSRAPICTFGIGAVKPDETAEQNDC